MILDSKQKQAVFAFYNAFQKAKKIRKAVDAIKKSILDTQTFVSQFDEGRIIDPKADWSMSDEDFILYQLDLANQLLEKGISTPEQYEGGYCPALVAEAEQIEAFKRALFLVQPDMTPDILMRITAKNPALRFELEEAFLLLAEELLAEQN
jgi:hypothetical protein